MTDSGEAIAAPSPPEEGWGEGMEREYLLLKEH